MPYCTYGGLSDIWVPEIKLGSSDLAVGTDHYPLDPSCNTLLGFLVFISFIFLFVLILVFCFVCVCFMFDVKNMRLGGYREDLGGVEKGGKHDIVFNN